MELGYIGLGKMGRNMVERLVLDFNYRVTAYDTSEEAINEIESLGARGAYTIADLAEKLAPPRTVWIMVPHKAVSSVLDELAPHLEEGDTVIDGGNSFYKNSIEHAKKLKKQGVYFLDAGVSGGPGGAREGACIMVGGDEEQFEKYEQLFADLTVSGGYGYMGAAGAGHFVKMVHNGIEYGMMQAIAEGFNLMKKSEYKLDLAKVAGVYNHGSVIESKLIEWLTDGFGEYGEDLRDVSGTVAHSGEGMWTVETAKEMKEDVPIIEGSLRFREESEKKPSYTGRILSALRNQFGGHSIKKEGQ